MTQARPAKFGLGQIVRHREEALRGLIVDVDARYAGPADQPGSADRDQPFYSVLAMGEGAGFMVYAAENVLEHETDVMPLSAEGHAKWFTVDSDGHMAPRSQPVH